MFNLPWHVIGWTVGATVAFAAFLAAITVIFKVVRVVSRVIAQGDKAFPVLIKLASQFENNGGSTIKDQMDRVEFRVDGHDTQLSMISTAITETKQVIGEVQKSLSELADLNALVAITTAIPPHEPDGRDLSDTRSKSRVDADTDSDTRPHPGAHPRPRPPKESS